MNYSEILNRNSEKIIYQIRSLNDKISNVQNQLIKSNSKHTLKRYKFKYS